ncbi:hypothetical protein DSECCO2_284290 [anaerobic digester metagenome]
MKKFITMITTVFMLMALATTAFATETPDLRSAFKENTKGVNLDITGIKNPIEPQFWPGSGPAPQVTSVVIEQVGFLEVEGHENNVGVLVRVMGYGRDYAKYDNSPVNYFKRNAIILSGTGADGWYYLYDCGEPTHGSHSFDIKLISTNTPYTEKSARVSFDITP